MRLAAPADEKAEKFIRDPAGTGPNRASLRVRSSIAALLVTCCVAEGLAAINFVDAALLARSTCKVQDQGKP